MSKFREFYNADIYRYGEKCNIKRFFYLLRKLQFGKNKLLKAYYKFAFHRFKEKRGLEIPSTVKIGKGLYLGHAYNITINGAAVIGSNCNIHKGVTIGQENRGERKGVPTIGDRVWIGINAVIVGSVTIGDDVLIAPNAYVNRSVPAHSVVFGNPCVIKHKDNATENYVNRTV